MTKESYSLLFPDKSNKDIESWGNRGVAFYYLGKYEQVIYSYDQSIAIKPECCAGVHYHKACCFSLQGLGQLIIENLQCSIAMNPEKYRERAKYNSDFDNIRKDERFESFIQG